MSEKQEIGIMENENKRDTVQKNTFKKVSKFLVFVRKKQR